MNRERDLPLALFAAVAIAHIAWFGDWVVEDAAISWAYGQNLARGLGAVPWPGAEPVEGFSNPAWVALIALFQLVGVHPFWSTRFLALLLTAYTVPLVARLAERSVPEAPLAAGLTAGAVFAVNTQVGIFGAAGLENPLFNLLLAAMLLRALVEHDARDRAPWSAVLGLLLALTRPEGVVYALAIGVLSTGWRLRIGRDRVELSRWWLVLLAPLLLWHFARWNYFAWALPATAYAKVPTGQEHLLVWNAAGWMYLRDFLNATGQGLVLPLYVVGMTGFKGRIAGLGALALAVGVPLYAWDTTPALDVARCLFPALAVAAIWGASLNAPHHTTRGTLLAIGSMVTFYAVYTRGDWMDGARWMAMAAVPSAVLLAAGAAEVALLLRSPSALPWRPLAYITAALGFAVFQVQHTTSFARELEISPWMVRERVRNGHEIAARLHVDERPVCLTVDMGAFLMWSNWELLDIVGLVDMPLAQHRDGPWFDRFIQEYVIAERRPHFIRIGNKLAQMKVLPTFQQQYFRGQHGWRIRRDLLFSPTWPGPEGRTVAFEGSTLVGWDVPEPRVAAGSEVYLEVGIDNDDDRDLKWWAFLVDENDKTAAAWELLMFSPAAEDWPDDAIFHSRLTLDLPDDLAPGRYRLGFAMRTMDGLNGPLAGAPLPEGVRVAWKPEDAVFRWGEVLYPDGIEVVVPEEALADAKLDLAEALERAGAGACEDAHDAWKRARWHGVPAGWAEGHATAVTRARAACWFARAEAEPDRSIDHLEAARKLDPDVPGLQAALRKASVARSQQAARDRRAGRVEEAYQGYRAALRLDPYRTWDRRHAEELRVLRYQMLDAQHDARRKETQ